MDPASRAAYDERLLQTYDRHLLAQLSLEDYVQVRARS